MSTTQKERSTYDEQADAFLAAYGISFQALTTKNPRPAPWATANERYGLEWRISLSGKTGSGLRSVTFPFWNSIAAGSEAPSAYDVLACISRDTYCADTFKDWCSDYGYDEDSCKAKATYQRCKRLAEKLQGFFTEAEIDALQEIQ